ncbi:hypothetical protein J6590_025644, partial [Homalodisca vitripennis]
HASAGDPSRYKWLPRHTHYLPSITCVQHGQQHMLQRAIPLVINGYLAHTHYLLIHHMSTTRTTAHGSACDPSRYKWLHRHTHYLSSIMRPSHIGGARIRRELGCIHKNI